MKWAFLIFSILFFMGVVSAVVYPALLVGESLAGGNSFEVEEQKSLSAKLEEEEITKDDFEEWYEEKKEKEIKNQIERENFLKFKKINYLNLKNNSFEFEVYDGETIKFQFNDNFYRLEFSTQEGHNFRKSELPAAVISKCYKVKYLNMKKNVCWDIE
jgi:preprotein translocase subunit SecF